MSAQFITIHSDNPNVHFENPLNLDLLRQGIERAEAMRLERLYGVPYKVKVTFVQKTEAPARGGMS